MNDFLSENEQQRQAELERQQEAEKQRLAELWKTRAQEISDTFERTERAKREYEEFTRLKMKQYSPSLTLDGNPLADKTDKELQAMAVLKADELKVQRLEEGRKEFLEQQKFEKEQEQAREKDRIAQNQKRAAKSAAYEEKTASIFAKMKGVVEKAAEPVQEPERPATASPEPPAQEYPKRGAIIQDEPIRSRAEQATAPKREEKAEKAEIGINPEVLAEIRRRMEAEQEQERERTRER